VRQAQDKRKTVKQTKEHPKLPSMLFLMHQHIKNTPGKLKNILLKPSS
jgi:hypothetical protein